jgi:malonyl-CoA decarboxylase
MEYPARHSGNARGGGYLVDSTVEAAAALARAADPSRQELLRRITWHLGGTGALIAMRSEITACLRGEPELKRRPRCWKS